MNIHVEYDIIDIGEESEQYFNGFGCAHTPYSDCAVGIGDTAEQAYSDALDQIAAAHGEEITDQLPFDCPFAGECYHDECEEDEDGYCGDPDCELHYYVGIRWRTVWKQDDPTLAQIRDNLEETIHE